MTRLLQGASGSVLTVVMLAAVVAGCATPPPAPVVERSIDSRRQTVASERPQSYSVRRGDTLYAIAWRYGIDYKELASWNAIPRPYTIYPKQNLRLTAPPPSQSPVAVRAAPESAPVKVTPAPSRSSPASGSKPASNPSPTVAATSTPAKAPVKAPAKTPSGSASKPTASTSPPPKPVGSGASGRGAVSFSWPTSGGVLSSFSSNDPTRNGIDISGKAGQRVNSAAAGQVVYSGTGLVGYGELIIVKHNDEWLSAYGHNRKRLVVEGDMVKSGQQIAELGDSGTNRPKLHFEIRKNGKPVDPQRYLPKK